MNDSHTSKEPTSWDEAIESVFKVTLRNSCPMGDDLCWVCEKKVRDAKAAINEAVSRFVIGDVPPESEHWRYNGELKGKILMAVEQRKVIGVQLSPTNSGKGGGDE